MIKGRLRGIGSASAVYLAAEVFTKAAQTVLVLGIAASSTKAQYASFVLVYAIHLLGTVLISGGILETLNAARSRNPAVQLMRPTLMVSGGISSVVLLAGACWAMLSFWHIAGETTITTAIGATMSAVGISIARNASTVLLLDNRHILAAVLRSTQLLFGYVLGGLSFYIFRSDPIGAFFCGYALGVCVTGLFFARFETDRTPCSAIKSEARALINDTVTFLPVSLFGWIFGYGFSWLIEFSNRPRDSVAEFSIVLSAAFICPIILTAVYNAWSPKFADSDNNILASEEHLNRLNSMIWAIPILGIGVSGVCLLLAWDHMMLAVGGKLLQYRFLERPLVFVFIGYAVHSLQYVVTTIFIREEAKALFFRVSLLGNILGIGSAMLLLYISSANIALGYGFAIAVRGVTMATVASLRWRAKLPILEICISAGALAIALIAFELQSIRIVMVIAIFVFFVLVFYCMRLKSRLKVSALGH